MHVFVPGGRSTGRRGTRKAIASVPLPQSAVLLARLQVRTRRPVWTDYLQPAIRLVRRRLVAAICVNPVHARATAGVWLAAKFEAAAGLNPRERRGYAFARLIVAVREHVIDCDVITLTIIAAQPHVRVIQLDPTHLMPSGETWAGDDGANQQGARVGSAGALLVGPGRLQNEKKTSKQQQQTDRGHVRLSVGSLQSARARRSDQHSFKGVSGL